jgi:Amidohydrolase family
MISFRHATVLACTGADPVDDATVVVEGAVIKDVLASTRSAAGADGEVIDCGGRTVMPGLIDAHVHVCAVEVDLAAQRRNYPASLLAYAAGKMISQTLDQGFTTVRDAGGADWGMKEAVGRGLIPGPRMFLDPVGPHRADHHPGRPRQRRQRHRISRIGDQQRPVRRGSAQPRPDIGQPSLRPPGQPDADAARRMTGQVPGHQSPGETGGAEHHHVHLTIPAHQPILGKPAPHGLGLPHDPERRPALPK